jgi:hypothetical protein
MGLGRCFRWGFRYRRSCWVGPEQDAINAKPIQARHPSHMANTAALRSFLGGRTTPRRDHEQNAGYMRRRAAAPNLVGMFFVSPFCDMLLYSSQLLMHRPARVRSRAKAEHLV